MPSQPEKPFLTLLRCLRPTLDSAWLAHQGYLGIQVSLTYSDRMLSSILSEYL